MPILLETTIYSAILFVCILLIRLLLKKKLSPNLQLAIWGLLILRLAIPVTIDSPIHLITIPEQPQEVVALPKEAEQPLPFVAGQQVDVQSPTANENHSHRQQTVEKQQQPIIQDSKPIEAKKQITIAMSIGEILLLAWLIGAMGLLGYTVLLYAGLRTKLNKNRQLPQENNLALFKETAKELGIKSVPKLICVNGEFSPALLLPNMVILPMELANSASEQQLKHILCHELTHYKRLDHVLKLILTALRIVYWFNPVIWLATPMICDDMEIACDNKAVNTTSCNKKEYATTLLTLFSKNESQSLLLGMANTRTMKVASKRIRGVFMKQKSGIKTRIITGLLALVLMVSCFTTACQPTPEKPIVQSKNNGKLKEALNKKPVDDSIGEIPSTLNDSFDGKPENVSIRIDANVSVPKNFNKISVNEYCKKNVDASFIQKLADHFCQGKTLYKPNVQLTKSELKAEIKKVEDIINSQRLDSEYGNNEDVKNEIREMNQLRYELLLDFYKTAPERVEKAEAIIEFSSPIQYINQAEYAENYSVATYFSKLGDKSAIAELDRLNSIYKAGEKLQQSRFEGIATLDNGYTGYIVAANYDSQFCATSVGFSKSKQIGADQKPLMFYSPNYVVQPLTIAEDEARALANDTINSLELNTDYILQRIERLNQSAERSQSYYRVVFTRQASKGIATTNYFDFADDYAENKLRPDYGFENIEIIITDEGIISFIMSDLLAKNRTVNDAVEIMDFDSIYNAFKQHAKLKYDTVISSTETEDGIVTTDYADKAEAVFTNASLGAIRIAKQNDLNSYYIVPVWIFSGKLMYLHEDGTPYGTFNETGEQSILSKDIVIVINALDGSIITADDCY